MISKEIWRYSLLNLNNRKMRSFLTILSVMVGIATIFIFVSFGFGLYNYVNSFQEELGIDKIVVQPRGIGGPGSDTTFRLDDTDLRIIERTRGISNIAGMMFRTAEIENNNEIRFNFFVSFPVHNADQFELAMEFMTVDVIDGRNLRRGDRNKVVLGYGYKVPNRIFARPLRVNDRIIVNGQRLDVVGFFEELGNPADDANIYTDEETYRRVVGITENNYAMIAARVDSVDNIPEIIERVERNLRSHRNQDEGKEDFFVQSFEELLQAFQNSLNFIIGFIFLIAFVSVVVSAINTANTMFTSILERTKEIGVLKSIGARNSQIMTLFLLEAGIQGFIAGVVGTFIGFLVAWVGGNVLSAVGFGFLQPYFSIPLFLACILFSTLVGTFSGVIPAYNASKQKPVDSLRYE
ncbi:MAG: ABC transporter permease [Candidatus Woesearchaeota archaeon]